MFMMLMKLRVWAMFNIVVNWLKQSQNIEREREREGEGERESE